MEESKRNWWFLLIPIFFILFYWSADRHPTFLGAFVALLFSSPFLLRFKRGTVPYIILKHMIVFMFLISFFVLNELSENDLLGVKSSGLCSEATWCYISFQFGGVPILVIWVLVDIVLMIIQIVKRVRVKRQS